MACMSLARRGHRPGRLFKPLSFFFRPHVPLHVLTVAHAAEVKIRAVADVKLVVVRPADEAVILIDSLNSGTRPSQVNVRNCRIEGRRPSVMKPRVARSATLGPGAQNHRSRGRILKGFRPRSSAS